MGRHSGFVANAVTRAGGTEYHGIGYEYLKNDCAQCGRFPGQSERTGRRRTRKTSSGIRRAGPILRNRLFFSSALEELISHSKQDRRRTYSAADHEFHSGFAIQRANRALSSQLLDAVSRARDSSPQQ